MNPLWRRAAAVFGQSPIMGLRRSRSYLQAEAARARLKFCGRGGPARVAASRETPPSPAAIKRVLFVKLWGTGDFILATPALQMLKARFASADFMLLGSTSAGRAISGVEGLFSRQALAPNSNLAISSPDIYRAIGEARSFAPDLIFLSPPLMHWRMEEAADFLGARWVFGPGRPGLARTADIALRPNLHMADWNIELARAAGCEGPAPSLNLWLNDTERDTARQWVAVHAPHRPRIALHLGSTPEFPQKAWPLKNFAELGRRLSARKDTTLVLLEGPNERDTVRRTASEISPAPIIAGAELSLRETFALLAEMDLVIAGSSVFVHAAAAVGTPVICLSGPTGADFGPWGASRGLNLQSPAACSPCYLPGEPLTCFDPHCMKEVTVAAVETAWRLLEDFDHAHDK